MPKIVKLSDNPVTAATSICKLDGFVARSESVAERVEKWFMRPLREMHGSQGFLVLLVLFPLYEKHLRSRHGMTGDFTKAHRIFKVIGRHLRLSEADAFLFWNHVRNGLLHRAAPKESEHFEYVLRSDRTPVEKINNCFWINPFALRDRLLEVIEPDLHCWKTDEVPLAISANPEAR